MERRNIDRHGESVIDIHEVEFAIKAKKEDAVEVLRADNGNATATGNGKMVCHENIINQNGRSRTHSLAG